MHVYYQFYPRKLCKNYKNYTVSKSVCENFRRIFSLAFMKAFEFSEMIDESSSGLSSVGIRIFNFPASL